MAKKSANAEVEKPALKLLDPAAMRRDQSIDVSIGNGQYVKARKIDMTTMVLEGIMPLPILTAMQKMIELPAASDLERVEALNKDKSGAALMTLLRKHAVIAVVSPKFVEDETDNPNEMWVQLVGADALMAIWNATAVIPMMEPLKAARFRGKPASNSIAPAPARESVRPAPESVDSPAVELKFA